MKGFIAFINRGNLISLAIADRHRHRLHRRGPGVGCRHHHAADRGDRREAELRRLLKFTVHHSQFIPTALFINAVLSFLIIAFVMYFLVVAPPVRLTGRLPR